jgi:hypothetical protein
VGGQHQRDRQAAQQLVEPVLVGTTTPQPDDSLGHGVVEHAVTGGPLAAPQRPDPATGLGQVDQLEVQREGFDDRLGGPEVEVGEVLVEAAPLLGIVVLAQRDRASADALDELEQLRAGLLGDHLAEQRAQEPDLR